MNCLEFRRLVTIDPRTRDEKAREHREQCPQCDAMYQRTLATEQLLDRAVNIDVPKDLASNILARHYDKHASKTRTWRNIGVNAIAASLILAAGIGLGMKLSHPVDTSLSHYVLQHVYDELPLLASSKPVDSAMLDTALKEEHLSLEEHIDNLKYAGACAIRNGKGIHMVVQGKAGPVTILLMPEESVAKRQTISDPRFIGIISPAPRGSLAVIGEKQEPIEKIENQIKREVQWL